MTALVDCCTNITCLPGADPDCPFCDGLGVDPLQALVSVTLACPLCTEAPFEAEPLYIDADDDGWLDGVHKVPAKWIRAPFSIPVTRIVMHRLHRGYHEAGPRYFANPGDGRYVSAHFVVHRSGWSRELTQCAPVNRICWHAGRGNNGDGIGIEHDYPGPDGYSDEMMAVTEKLVLSLLGIHPTIIQVVAHSRLSESRSDPGDGFDWRRYRAMGLGVVI